MEFNDFADGGIVLLAQYSGDTKTTFKGPGDNGTPGTPGVVRNLTEANYIASKWFPVGRFDSLHLTIGGNLSALTGSFDVVLERRRKDSVNGGIYAPSIVSTVRTDAPGTPPANSQTILAADLTPGAPLSVSDWDGSAAGATPANETSRTVLLITTDAVLSGEVRVLIKCAAAPHAGDIVFVAVTRG